MLCYSLAVESSTATGQPRLVKIDLDLLVSLRIFFHGDTRLGNAELIQ